MSDNIIRIGIYNGFGVDKDCFTDTQIWIERNLNGIKSKNGKPLFEIVNRSPHNNEERMQDYGLQPEHLRDENFLNNLDFLFFPGGNALENVAGIENFPEELQQPDKREEINQYIKELEKTGTKDSIAQINIRKFMEKGGAVIGTCAGAYYLSRCMRYSKSPDPNDHSWDIDITPKSNVLASCLPLDNEGHPSKNMRKFPVEHRFAGKSIVYAEVFLNYSQSDSNLGEVQVPLLSGGNFKNYDEKDVKSYANFSIQEDQGGVDIYSGLSSLVKFNIGKGRVTGLSVHPELRPETVERLRNTYKIFEGFRVQHDTSDPENKEAFMAKQEDLDKFSSTVVLDDLIYSVKYLNEYGHKPDLLPELDNRNFEERFYQEKIANKQAINKPKEDSELISRLDRRMTPRITEIRELQEMTNRIKAEYQANQAQTKIENANNPTSQSAQQSMQDKPKKTPLLQPKPNNIPKM